MAAPYCDQCGKPTITKCPCCETDIRGYYYIEGGLGGGTYRPPKFCFRCGEPFPWHAAKIEAAQELADDLYELHELSIDDHTKLKAAIGDLSSDTPRTELAIHRYRTILARLSNGAASVLKPIALEIATEAAKKLILGGDG